MNPLSSSHLLTVGYFIALVWILNGLFPEGGSRNVVLFVILSLSEFCLSRKDGCFLRPGESIGEFIDFPGVPRKFGSVFKGGKVFPNLDYLGDFKPYSDLFGVFL